MRHDLGIDSLVVHAGRLAVPDNPASSPPLFQASSYEFADLDDVEAIYAGEREGRIYGRFGGPNASQFEDALARLEGAAAAVGAASGMAAIDAALATSLGGVPAIVADADLYGGTRALLAKDYQERGVTVTTVDASRPGVVAEALARSGARVLYLEAVTNPLLRIRDLPALAEVAHAAGARLVVDATFLTPVLARPLDLGADLVVHSVGKYLGGHGDVGAGVVAGGEAAVAAVRAYLVRRGATMPHFEAWLATRGLRTLALRMPRHVENALTLAAHLAGHPRVAHVHHPSLVTHPDHALAARIHPRGTGGIVAFDLADPDDVPRFLAALRTIRIVHSLGEVATTIAAPRLASHRGLTDEERAALGITAATLRLSAGIEDVRDLVHDVDRALDG